MNDSQVGYQHQQQTSGLVDPCKGWLIPYEWELAQNGRLEVWSSLKRR